MLVIGRRCSFYMCSKLHESPALGTVRLIARKMLYVKVVFYSMMGPDLLHGLSVNLAEKINIPHHSDSHCHCMGSMISSSNGSP